MKRLREQHALAFALAAAALAVVCFSVMPEGPAWALAGVGVPPAVTFALLQSGVAAVVMAVLYLPSGGCLLDKGSRAERGFAAGRGSHTERGIAASGDSHTDGNFPAGESPGTDKATFNQSRQTGYPFRKTLLVVLGVAAAVGVAKVVVQTGDVTAPIASVAAFALMLVATAVFEEILFRGLLFEGFAKTFSTMGTRNNALLSAAIASSLLFGILHVTSDLGSLFRMTAYFQAAAKVAEGALFGLVMCALYVKLGSIWPCVLLHACFNILSEGPIFAITGIQTSTYITGSPMDLAIVAAAALLLAIPAKWAYDSLRS